MNLFDTFAFDELIFDVDVCHRPDEVSTKRFQRGVLGPSVDPSADPASDDFRELSLFGSDCSTTSFEVDDGIRFFSLVFSFVELLVSGIAGIGLSVLGFSGTGGIGRVLGFSGTGGIGRVFGNSGTGGMGRLFFGF